MVIAVINSLNERGGSSRHAIKKYIAANSNVDVEKRSSFIRKALKSAVDSGSIAQTKGKGASGSFKIGAKKTDVSKKSTPKKTAAKKIHP